MDSYERLAKRLSDKQDKRWQNCTLQQKVQFWTAKECEIWDTIAMLRKKSKTYQQ